MILDAYGQHKKHKVMHETWSHLYPVPGAKYPGILTFALGEYGDNIIVVSDFENLSSSPQRYELEHTIFNHFHKKEPGCYTVQCTLWFFKTASEMYLEKPIGKIIKIKLIFS